MQESKFPFKNKAHWHKISFDIVGVWLEEVANKKKDAKYRINSVDMMTKSLLKEKERSVSQIIGMDIAWGAMMMDFLSLNYIYRERERIIGFSVQRSSPKTSMWSTDMHIINESR